MNSTDIMWIPNLTQKNINDLGTKADQSKANHTKKLNLVQKKNGSGAHAQI